MFYPSIAAHAIGGFFLFIAIVYILIHSAKLQALDTYRILVLILLFSIVITLHGVSHVLLEKEYNFVPWNLWELPKKAHVECPCMKGALPRNR
jgi:hypothetical protein